MSWDIKESKASGRGSPGTADFAGFKGNVVLLLQGSCNLRFEDKCPCFGQSTVLTDCFLTN